MQCAQAIMYIQAKEEICTVVVIMKIARASTSSICASGAVTLMQRIYFIRFVTFFAIVDSFIFST